MSCDNVSITILDTNPIAPFVSPSLTSIFVVIMTLAPTLTCRIFLRLPVSRGHSGILTVASCAQSSFFPSEATLVLTVPGSKASLLAFHSSQCSFCAKTCMAFVG